MALDKTMSWFFEGRDRRPRRGPVAEILKAHFPVEIRRSVAFFIRLYITLCVCSKEKGLVDFHSPFV